jgi:hypothetical protein
LIRALRQQPGYLLGLLLIGLPGAVLAQSPQLSEPFAVRNQNPFVLAYGLPISSAPDRLAQDAYSLQLQLDITNNSKDARTSREQIVLDGETYSTALVYQRGLGDGWQFGVALPLIGHHSGFMDNFIEGWHDTFGLSNGDREDWPKNRLYFSYTRDGVNGVELTDGTNGIGDLQLQISRPFYSAESGGQWQWHASLELPTGDADRLLGSGSTDLALWVSASYPELIASWDVGGYLHAGLVLTGDGDLLPDQVESQVWFGGAGLHWRLWSWLTLKGQLDIHGPFYDSRLDQLGKQSVLLTVGGNIPMDKQGGAIDLAIGENLLTDAVPDFMINLAYRQRF